MSCNACGQDVPIENTETGLCASCNRIDRDNSIIYPKIKKMFLDKMVEINASCPVTDRPLTVNDDVHHKMGRIGFASEEQRENGINLLIDVDYFLGVTREGHEHIEKNREEAIRRGWTLERSGTHNY